MATAAHTEVPSGGHKGPFPPFQRETFASQLLWFAIYMGLHRSILDALDQRSARIKAELDEALRLKEEAQKLLAEYQRRHQEAEREGEAIIASARTEAERVAAEAKAKMEDFVARRTKMADAKIGQAEA